MRLCLSALLCLIFLFCISCASNKPATLKSLEKRTVKIQKKNVQVSSKEDVREKYRAFLESAPVNHPRYSEVLSRLADLEMEAGDDKAFSEREDAFLEAYKATEALEEKETRGTKNYKNAIKLYQDFLKKNPKDPRNDWILYRLARAYERSGRVKSAQRALSKLIKSYPKSEYIVEAYFRQGESAFFLKKYQRASFSYRQVVQQGKDSVYFERALHKLGWSLFNQEKYSESVNTFFSLFERLPVQVDESGKTSFDGLSRPEKELLNDVYRAINLSFSYWNGVAAVNDFFAKRGQKPYELAIYMNLAEYYQEHDRLRDAAEVYGQFAKRRPLHTMSPFMQKKQIDTYAKGKFFRSALLARKQYVKSFGVKSDYWKQLDGAARIHTKDDLKKILDELSSFYHARAQQRRRESDYTEATTWYLAYIDAFPGDAKLAQYYFLLGELYTERKKYKEAISAYSKSAYESPKHPKSAEAGYAAIIVYQKYLPTLKNSKAKTHWKERFDLNIELFVKTFPSDVRVPALMATLADNFYRDNKIEKAIVVAKELLAMGPALDKKLQHSALLVIGQASFSNQNYILAQENYIKILALNTLSKKDRIAYQERLAVALFKNAEVKQKNDDKKGALLEFQRVAQLTPMASIRPQADFDAAAIMIELKMWKSATVILEAFKKSYPRHKLQADIPEKLAFVYQQTNDFEKAAREYEIIAGQLKTGEKKRASFWVAAEFYEKAGIKKRAIAAYKNYVKQYSQPFEPAMEARFKLVQLYQQVGQEKSAKFWLKAMVKVDKTLKKNRTDRMAYLAAKASFMLAEQRFSSFANSPIVHPLKKSLRKKKRLMTVALKSFEDTLKYNVEEFTTASTYRVAEVYATLGKDLLNSERPKGLSEEEIEEYNLLLEEQAYPFEEKAIEAHVANVENVKKGVYDNWIKRSFAALGELQPARYAKSEADDGVIEAVY